MVVKTLASIHGTLFNNFCDVSYCTFSEQLCEKSSSFQQRCFDCHCFLNLPLEATPESLMSIQFADIHFYLLRLFSAVGYSSCANTLQNQFILGGKEMSVLMKKLSVRRGSYLLTAILWIHQPLWKQTACNPRKTLSCYYSIAEPPVWWWGP